MPLLSRHNPFGSSPSSPGPSVVGSEPAAAVDTNVSHPPSVASVPAITLSPPPGSSTTQSRPTPQLGLDSTDLEEPPPYTPSASVTSGETTVEVGPRNPFQAAQPSANPSRNGLSPAHNQVAHNRIPSSSSLSLPSSSRPTPSDRAASFVQQFTNSLTNAVNNLNSHASSHSNTSNQSWGAASAPRPTWQSNTWTSYPGQNARSTFSPSSNPTSRNAHLVRPPRHPASAPLQPPPLSTSTHSLPPMANHSSDFARDFYAAGTGSGENLVTENTFAPPTGPPPSERQASTAHSVIPNDGRPTSQPQVGHPLLNDGKLLVYPRGFECRKCYNVGYIDTDPKKPCKHCWKRYAKPFAGPLVYSFPANTASSSLASNFQKPLPHIPPRAPPPTRAAFSSPPSIPLFAPGGYMSNPQGGFQSPPGLTNGIPPPRSSVTYVAGDARIGGTLCLRCGGKGYIDVMFFDRETCRSCSGIGRVFL